MSLVLPGTDENRKRKCYDEHGHDPYEGGKRLSGGMNNHEEGDSRMSEAFPQKSLDWTKISRDPLVGIANDIHTGLGSEVAGDTISLCGPAPLATLATRPADTLHLAQQKLYTWRYDALPEEWRRLYEDACIHLAAQGLLKISSSEVVNAFECEHPFSKAVELFDKALFIVGAPGRKALLESTFDKLEGFLAEAGNNSAALPLNIHRPSVLVTDYPIRRHEQPLSMQNFQTHLNNHGGPIIIAHALDNWPAIQKWGNIDYLLQRTLGGRRIVPVEIGESYTDKSWTQRVMPFAEYVQNFLIPEHPEQIGYMAQHDLLGQIPKLKNDIIIPDYCWTAPPEPKRAAADTFGLRNTPALDEPQHLAWLGPKGTKTPLHTDAYHNILCQVVGYKYVRLYAPEERQKLYPVEGLDERGVNLGNTSSIDVKYISANEKEVDQDEGDANALQEEFPRFREAKYQEAILGPGECLYIPLGWWHYVESLTNSFSVSFWFN